MKSHVEVSDVDEQIGIVTRERNLPRYLSDYTEVPGQKKLQTIKNRRKSTRANLTRKMNIIKMYLKERKDRKLINLACTQLNRVWEQLIETHKLKNFKLCVRKMRICRKQIQVIGVPSTC